MEGLKTSGWVCENTERSKKSQALRMTKKEWRRRVMPERRVATVSSGTCFFLMDGVGDFLQQLNQLLNLQRL